MKEEKKLVGDILHKAILNSANYMIISTDTNGALLTFNKAAEKWLGYKAEEVIGKYTPILIHDIQEVEKKAVELTRELGKRIEPGFDVFVAKARMGLPDENEWTYIRKDGSRFPVSLSVTSIYDDDGDIIGFLGIGTDISEKKKAEEEIRLLQMMSSAVYEKPDFDAALGATLELICEKTGWNLGRAWIPDQEGKKLLLSSYWVSNDLRLDTFRKESEQYTFKKGYGVPGDVWVSKKPGWMSAASMEKIFLRWPSAKKAGIKAGITIPVLSGDEVVAIMEFFLLEPLEEDHRLLTSIFSVAMQLGSVMQRKKIESALQEALKNEFSKTVENLQNFVFKLKKLEDGSVVYTLYAGKLADEFGLSSKKTFNRTPQEIFGPSIGNYLNSKFQDAFNGEVIHFETIYQEKSLFVTLSPIIENAQVVEVVGSAIDITERKIIEEQLKKYTKELEKVNQELYSEKQAILEQRNITQSILQASHEGFVMTDKEGRVFFSNQRVEEYFDMNCCVADSCNTVNILESINKLTINTVGNTLPVSELMERLYSGELDQIDVQFAYENEKDKSRFFELYGTPVYASHISEKRGFLFVFRDRSEEERVNRLKNEFINIVSHELKTPLASIIGFIELLLKRTVSAEKQAKYLETVYKEGSRLSNLVNDFLDIQRMETGRQSYHFVRLDITKSIHGVVELWQGRQGHKIIVQNQNKPIYILGDQDRFSQLIHNLLSNAIKYSPESNRVNVTIQSDHEKVKVDIEDFGLGIPADNMEKIFDRFYRVDNSDWRRIGGTGLGLAISKEIVMAHDGEITVKSQVGKGSIFTIRIPMA